MRTDPRIGAADLFVCRVTWVLAAIGIGYGLVTGIVGAEVWGPPSDPGDLYSAAMVVPGAPQTWGAAAAICGVLILVGQRFRRYRLLQVGCLLFTLWLLFFATAFALDVYAGATDGLLPACSHAALAILTAARADLARRWRRYVPA